MSKLLPTRVRSFIASIVALALAAVFFAALAALIGYEVPVISDLMRRFSGS